MALTHICSGHCHKCTAKQLGPDWKEKGRLPVIRTFHLVRALYSAGGRFRPEAMDCWECQECGELVPYDGWRTYQTTGNIIVRQSGKRRN